MRERHGLLLAGDEHHLRGSPAQWLVGEGLIGILDNHPVLRKELGKSTGSVKPDAVFSFSMVPSASPGGLDGQDAGQRIELTLLREQRLTRRPPIPRQETRHHSVATPAVPDKQSTGLQYPRELPDHAGILRWVPKEAKRCEEVEHCIEAAAPLRR